MQGSVSILNVSPEAAAMIASGGRISTMDGTADEIYAKSLSAGQEKNEKLIGNKFMIVEPVHHMKGDLSQIVAIDIIGAGIGEYVLVAQGSAARIGCGVETAPVDAAIVGIVDDGAGLE